MNQSAATRRKVIYIGAIALLLFPLFLLGQPATGTRDDQKSAGGQLSRLRTEYNLSQADLGDIDPAGESIKLATLGLRGVAANLLWGKATEYKKTKSWDSLSATLNQITKLQPNYITVWEYQGHNLSYNISVEFDNYRHRYQWVKKGIDFLVKGTRYNRDNPRLLWSIGWFMGQKFGRADERLLYRKLFREDTEFHEKQNKYVEIESNQARGPDKLPDTWLVGRLWYGVGQEVVATKGVQIKSLVKLSEKTEEVYQGRSPLVFHSTAHRSKINHAEAIQEEGYLDEKSEYAWREAGKDWRALGDIPIPSSWGVDLRLNDFARLEQDINQMRDDIGALAPEARDRIRQDKLENELTPEERDVLAIADAERDAAQMQLASLAEDKLRVTPYDLAFRSEVSEDIKNQARAMADEIQSKSVHIGRVFQYRTTVNFGYWAMRCRAEQTPTATSARRLVFEADAANDESDLITAKEKYEGAWKNWAQIFEKYPDLMHDETAEILMESIRRYARLHEQLDVEFPRDFPLQALMDMQRRITEMDRLADEFASRQDITPEMMQRGMSIAGPEGAPPPPGFTPQGAPQSLGPPGGGQGGAPGPPGPQ
ncbi:MAG: IRE (iron responsive element) [Pirellulaceae bacterium]|nr:IRE (iron responsive element) [Pirellulaceae bacterium]